IVITLLMTHCAPSVEPRTTLPDRFSEGRRIVEQAVEAHGGMDRWTRFTKLTVDYREHWSWPFTWLRKNPWPWNDVHATLRFWLHEARAEVAFEGQPNQTWVYRDGKVSLLGLPAKSLPHWRPDFVMPRTHYLTLLPFKFLDSGAHLEYLGKRPIAGQEFDEVLVTFEKNVGSTSRDKYWALFDPDTGRLTRLRLTVTAYGRLAVGEIIYEDFREVQGVLLASRLRGYWKAAGANWPLHLGTYSEPLFQE